MRTSRVRVYRSPLREEQALATRRRILDGVLELIGAGAVELEIPALARRTRVSVPTIYRHFPARTDLLRATMARVDELVPWAGPAPDPRDLRPFLRAFFEHRAAVAAKLGPLADSPILWEMRKASTVPERRRGVDALLDAVAPGLDRRRRGQLSDILVVLISHNTAVAFQKYVDCTPAETAERVAWLLESVLADANRRPRKKR